MDSSSQCHLWAISELMRLDRCDISSAEITEDEEDDDDDVWSREEIRLKDSFKRSRH